MELYHIIIDVASQSMENENMVNFLEADYNQCFQQLRHYDSQLFDSVKFLTTAYVGLIGIGIGLYEFGIKECRDFRVAVMVSFLIAFLLGLFMYMLIIRNRVYYVHVTRYVNEVRKTFLEKKPLGFENKSRMYTNYEQPPFFNWRSSQAYLMCVIAFVNSVLCGAIFFILFSNACCCWFLALSGALIFLFLQVGTGILYLKTREGKSASSSVFGRD